MVVAVNDISRWRMGLLSSHIAKVHNDAMQIDEIAVPDDPYDVVGTAIFAQLMPGGRDGTIRYLSFGRWWR